MITGAPPRVAEVLVVAEHSLIAESVRRALVDRGFVVSARLLDELLSDEDAAHHFARDQLDWALLLCELEPSRRLQRARSAVRRLPRRCLLLTDAESGPLWGAMLEVGVETVMSNAAGLDAVAEALRGGSGGPHALDAGARTRLLRDWHSYAAAREAWTTRIRSLSPRERSVLEMLYQGTGVPELAEFFEVSEATVRSQVRGVLVKLGVTSQLAAVAEYSTFREALEDAFSSAG